MDSVTMAHHHLDVTLPCWPAASGAALRPCRLQGRGTCVSVAGVEVQVRVPESPLFDFVFVCWRLLGVESVAQGRLPRKLDSAR